MISPGKIVLFRFPQTDYDESKLRPALIIQKLPGEYNDWLICITTSKIKKYRSDYDVTIEEGSNEFNQTGLKKDSVIRITRIAVANEDIFVGSIGSISDQTLYNIRKKLADWINPG